MAAAEGGGAAAAAGGGGGGGMAGGNASAATMHGWSGTMLFRRGMQTLGAIWGGMTGSDMYGG
jgi:hypothetical protein